MRGLDFPLFQLAVDGTYVFYNDDKFIYRTGMYGGNVERFIALPVVAGSPVVDMISDGHALYITDGKLVYRVPVSGHSGSDFLGLAGGTVARSRRQ